MQDYKTIGFFIKGLDAFDAHIKPIIDAAPDESFRFIIFHINDYYSPEIRIIPSTNVRLVDLTEKISFKKVLLINKCDIMFSLSPGNIFDLFFLSVCKSFFIKTVYYQHGIQLDFTTFDPKNIAQNKSLSRRFESFKRYTFFYRTFARNILSAPGKKKLLNSVLTKTVHLFFPSGRRYPKYGLKTDHCEYAFVYGEADKKYLVESMDMNPERIFLSGYPFVQPAQLNEPEKNARRILYISSGLRKAGVIPASIDEEKEFYKELLRQTSKANYKLTIKLHPIENKELFDGFFGESEQVEIIKSGNLADLTISSDIVIGDYSTALFYAVKYYKPIIILESKYFAYYPFEFTLHKIGFKSKLEELAAAIKKAEKPELNAYQMFLDDYFGKSDSVSPIQIVYSKISQIIDGSKENTIHK